MQLWDRFRLTLPDHDIWSDIQAIQSAARLRPNAVEVVEAEGRRAASLRHRQGSSLHFTHSGALAIKTLGVLGRELFVKHLSLVIS